MIYPLHTWVVTFEPTHSYLGTNCLPYQCQLRSNEPKNSELYDQFDHLFCCIITNISNWCTCSPQGPLRRNPYYITWYTHKVNCL